MMTESVEVVSLSVCNSGKGEITYEGTEGLQSALKSAGVDSMILTLWTVTKFGASPPKNAKNLIKIARARPAAASLFGALPPRREQEGQKGARRPSVSEHMHPLL